MGFLLAMVSVFLAAVLFPFGLVVTLFINLYKRRWKDSLIRLDLQFLSIATSIDAAGNVVCKDLFNVLLIHDHGYKFGNRKETISSVLGKNERDGTLKSLGEKVVFILAKFQSDHSFKSIDDSL
jgi:hypothetical protein